MSQQAKNSEQLPLAFGVSPVAAAIAAFGFSLYPWAFFFDRAFLNFLALAIGFGAITLGMNLPQRGKYAWYTWGLLLVGLTGSVLAALVAGWLLPKSLVNLIYNTFIQQLVMFAVLFLFFVKLILAQNPRLHPGE